MASGIRKAKAKQNIQEINEHEIKLAKALQNLYADLSAMMKGDSDSEGAYWNGSKALKFYKKAINNLKGNIEDYCFAYNKLNDYAIAYENSVQGDKG
jgi:hypothetical protein